MIELEEIEIMDYGSYKLFAEVMEVEKIVDVVHSETRRQYRLEIVKHAYGTASVHYAVNYYERSSSDVWVVYHNFPWVRQETAEAALREALSYVAYRPQLGTES